MANGGAIYTAEFERLDDEYKEAMYRAQTGRSNVKNSDYQIATLKYCLGFDPNDESSRLVSTRMVESKGEPGENYFLPSKEEMENCVGIVLSGSAANLKNTEGVENNMIVARSSNVVEWAQEHGIPILGLCYGSQILNLIYAKRGAEWMKPDKTPGESGIVTLEKTEIGKQSSLLADLPDEFSIMQHHVQQVINNEATEANFKVLASSRHCEVQIVTDGKTVIAIQGHPEVSAVKAAVLEVAEKGEKNIDFSDISSKQLGMTTHVMFTGFLNMVKEHVAERRRSS